MTKKSTETEATPSPQGEAVQPSDSELLEKRASELKEANDKYLRLVAEFENFKKRSSRDQLESMKYAFEPVLKELLPILDNLERAYFHSKESQDIQKLIEGLQLILKQGEEALARLGVSPIPAKGELFDPMKHQAITQVETDEIAENHVVEEISKGYLFKDRVLRPSMVSVSKKKC